MSFRNKVASAGKFATCIMLFSITLAFLTGTTTAIAGTTPNATQPYSTWMSTSFLSKNRKIDNHYVPAVLYEGFQKAATLHKNATLLNYTSKAVSSLVSSNGTIINWNPDYYSLDDIRIGNNFLYFWDSEGRKEKKYEVAAAALLDQLHRFPRNKAGGFWHRSPSYPNQMWLDGIYMAETFYATYTSYFDSANTTAWNDIALQFDLVEEHTRNHTSNLLVHGYDESKKAKWADPVMGASPHVWDRAVGWYFMALVEVLEVYPKELSGYTRLHGYLTALAEGVEKAQDTTGGWWLVMDGRLLLVLS
jgi:rhamnogalacturonyl hydrolase YesR